MRLAGVDPSPDWLTGLTQIARRRTRSKRLLAEFEIDDVEAAIRLDEMRPQRPITWLVLMTEQNTLRAHAKRQIAFRALLQHASEFGRHCKDLTRHGRAEAMVRHYVRSLERLEIITPYPFPGTRELVLGAPVPRPLQLLRKLAIHDRPTDLLGFAWGGLRTRLGV